MFFLCVCSHNDLAWQIRVYFKNQLSEIDLSRNGSGGVFQTDIPRLRAGRVGAQVGLHMCISKLSNILWSAKCQEHITQSLSATIYRTFIHLLVAIYRTSTHIG